MARKDERKVRAMSRRLDWVRWLGEFLVRSWLFGADGQDVFAANLDFDAEGRANVAALHDGATNPDIAGQIGGLEGIVEIVAAGIADQRVVRGAIAVIVAKFIHVGDVFEQTRAVGSFERKAPIPGAL